MTDSGRIYGAAIRMLSQREHSEAELLKKLSRKFAGADKEQLQKMTAELKADGLLSDERFAESLIRSRTGRGYGPYYIRRELSEKGIDSGLAEQLLAQAEIDWVALARGVVSRRHPNAQADESAWGKAIRFLQRRGFSNDLVLRAVGDRP